MSVIKMSEKARTLYIEMVEDFYTIAAQATVLAMVERNFMLSLRMLD